MHVPDMTPADLIEIIPGRIISTKGIKAIKYTGAYHIVVEYITGSCEDFAISDISMQELLMRLRRHPSQNRRTDSS